MAVIKPWAMNALAGAPLYDGPTLRGIFGALLHAGQSATLPLPGVLDPRALAVDVSSDPTVVVSAGLGVVVTSGGGYVTGLDGAWTGTLAARHATLSRIDRAILEVLDTTTQRTAQVRLITGTAASQPAAPALPSSALSLGTIAVPSASGGQAVVTDTRLFSAAAGGVIHVPDNPARLRVPFPPAGITQLVIQEDTGTLWKVVGTVRTQIDPDPRAGSKSYAEARGSTVTTAAIGADAGSVFVDVTFPPGRFTVPPAVSLTALSGRLSPWPSLVTKDGFRYNVNNWSNGTAPAGSGLLWSATQMSANAGEG